MLAGNRKKERLRGGKGREGGSNWVRGETTNVEITDATPTKRRVVRVPRPSDRGRYTHQFSRSGDAGAAPRSDYFTMAVTTFAE